VSPDDLDPRSLFGPLVDNYATVTVQPDPLQAEVFTSDMIGVWWRQEFTFDDPDTVLGEGVIRQAAAMATSEAVALLACMRTLAPTAQGRALAEAAAAGLIDAGVAAPAWASSVGIVHASKCWYGTDVYDDAPVVLCSFVDSRDAHAMVVRIDNTVHGGGFAQDIDLIDDLPDVLSELRMEARTSRGTKRLSAISRAKARALIEKSLLRTDKLDIPVADTFARFRALALARCRAMPRPTPLPVPSAEERRTLVESLTARSTAPAVCAELLVDYSCDVDTGDPLRISPSKIENFLRRWAPDRPEMDKAAIAAMPEFMVDYVEWAAERRKLNREVVDRTKEKIVPYLAHFTDTYGAS
jgi:hypothetical protein